ncbi:hypothetical protein MFLO_13108 [Listeria floridensis FSL S10-1187]|uniref:DUF2507 domain-containing protein n=2 Tax=Listeria floridensis TaxID=1494962 RepID=A0ABN0RCP3_9LIST|nr:YslB family protein [Listeria floridensis]EUJ27409.1 hypothetical protein MFLO_13108 [Listeria floridensis FSL S10-1187]
MTEESNHEITSEPAKNLVPSFGIELFRDYLLPELLGEETPHILYWAGKDLARKFPLASFEEISAFFAEASFGSVAIAKEKKDELQIILSGNAVETRFNLQNSPSFKLEAGFIAEQIQTQRGYYTEAYDEVNTRKKEVVIVVKWDRKESVESEIE